MAQIALSAPQKIKPAPFDWKKWLGVIPFFLFAILFLILPSMRLFIGSFTGTDGKFTIANIFQLFQQKNILDAYWLSIRISAVTAIGGGILPHRPQTRDISCTTTTGQRNAAGCNCCQVADTS